MRAEKVDPVLPENPAPYLTDWFLEIGPTAGEIALGWPDLVAWSRLTGVELTPWEARTIRRLSKTFLNQKFDARKPNCPEPRVQADQAETRKRVDEQFKALMGALAKGR
ncbi:hypothetical protein [Novosphingobium sp. HII-3]|uniref:phage tail assembly chaperone n=1 Tax=Novosphingobium sp. HII-3 TaxID=2075565 RepID=UPI001304B76E|nr:hypothetical protein [Novosphingobium sp. HII-3]